MGKGASTIRFKVETTIFRFIGDNWMQTNTMNLEQESVKAAEVPSKASRKPLAIQ